MDVLHFVFCHHPSIPSVPQSFLFKENRHQSIIQKAGTILTSSFLNEIYLLDRVCLEHLTPAMLAPV